VRDTLPPESFDIAAIGLQFTEKQGEETGFSAAIGTGKRDFLSREQARVSRFK
jgi:hypothetical protein